MAILFSFYEDLSSTFVLLAQPWQEPAVIAVAKQANLAKQVAKGLLNNIFGKLGQQDGRRSQVQFGSKVDLESTELFQASQKLKMYPTLTDIKCRTQPILKHPQDPTAEYHLYEYDLPSQAPPRNAVQIPMLINARGRVLIHQAMSQLQCLGAELYYVDTDSIFFSLPTIFDLTSFNQWFQQLYPRSLPINLATLGLFKNITLTATTTNSLKNFIFVTRKNYFLVNYADQVLFKHGGFKFKPHTEEVTTTQQENPQILKIQAVQQQVTQGLTQQALTPAKTNPLAITLTLSGTHIGRFRTNASGVLVYHQPQRAEETQKPETASFTFKLRQPTRAILVQQDEVNPHTFYYVGTSPVQITIKERNLGLLKPQLFQTTNLATDYFNVDTKPSTASFGSKNEVT